MGRGVGSRNTNICKSGADRVVTYAYADNDDDFEDKYIVSGPTAPVQFKSCHPSRVTNSSANTSDLLQQKVSEFGGRFAR